jgi:Fe-S-cluster containining protein
VSVDTLHSTMAALYREVDAAVAAHSPVCTNRGACCKFGSFGHRLYVTDVELAYFVDGLKDHWRPPTAEVACPYQVEGLCTARDHRPLGCRIYFCDANAQAWQGPEYERFLTTLKELGARLDVPYRYREWLSALDDAGTAIKPVSRPSGTGPPVDGIRLPVIQ